MQKELQKDQISLDVPSFDESQETKYNLWEEKLDTLGVQQYDTIVAHSFGCAVIMQYIIKNQISLNRLVLVAPSGLV
jgi:predicted alpha/beta hydrolase family esterase